MAPRVQPGNPLWLEWVEQAARKAEETGSKAATTYKKAARSFQLCPTPFSHPDESAALSFVGPGIIKMLTSKLKEHCEQTGEPFPERVGPSRKGPKTAAAKKRKKGQTSDEEREEEAARDARRQRTLGGGVPLPPGPAPAPSPDISPPPAKRKVKPYIPRRGSGSYAILLALYLNATAEDHQVWTTKPKVIADATPYSDTSLEKPSAARNGGIEPGAGFYTAWSSMKTLIDKDFVLADNKRPIKYCLTESGYSLAEGLCSAAGIPLHVADPSSGGAAPYAPRRDSGPVAGRVSDRSPSPAYEDEDEDFRCEMEKAMRLSRLESQSSGGSAPYAPRAGPSGHQRPAISLPKPLPLERPRQQPSSGAPNIIRRDSGPPLDGRKAASGHYANRAAPAVAGPIAGNIDSAFAYFYLDENDQRVLKKEDAEVGQEDVTLAPIYRIEYRSRQDLHKMAAGVLRKTSLVRPVPLPGGSTMSGYIRERVSNVIAPGFPDLAASKAPAPSSDPMADLLAGFRPVKKVAKDAMYAAPADVRRLGSDGKAQEMAAASLAAAEKRAAEARAKKAAAAPVAPRQEQQKEDAEPIDLLAAIRAKAAADAIAAKRPIPLPTTSTFRPAPQPQAAPKAAPPPPKPTLPLPKARPLGRTTSSQNPLAASFDYSAAQPLVNRHPLDPVRDHISAANYVFQPFDATIVRAGTFKVVLVIDTREVGPSKAKRTEMIDELTKQGVLVDRRMLALGDMLWVARKVDAAGKPTGEDDIVLDAIVERKRLDDLCSSIIDGRYAGQKIRIKDSAITQRIYLIEKYDDKSQYLQFGKAIWTCKSQLQVNDGFLVHESANFEDTISYLRMRTQIMIDIYQSNDLHVIPDDNIDRPTYLSQQKHLRALHPSKRFLTSYAMFDALNKPSAALSLKQQWASMIQRVQGLSAEKTVQFLGRWETPIAFWEESAAWRDSIAVENEAMDIQEAEEASLGVKKKKEKRRKADDFVADNLDDVAMRGIKGKLGSKLYHLFAQEKKYVY